MKKIFLYLFLLVSAGEIISTLTDMPLLHMVCKPALMIILALYYWSAQRYHQLPTSGVVLLAIIFSGAGDVLLMLFSAHLYMPCSSFAMDVPSSDIGIMKNRDIKTHVKMDAANLFFMTRLAATCITGERLS